VFNSTDHLGVGAVYGDPGKDLWNKLIEGIEFTVYGTNDLSDALAAAGTPGVSVTAEAGTVPGSGVGSTFEKAAFDCVFFDGWADFANPDEGDDFASVWQFTQAYRYIYITASSRSTRTSPIRSSATCSRASTTSSAPSDGS